MSIAKKTIADDPKVKDAPKNSAHRVDSKVATNPVAAQPGANQPPVVRRGPGTKEVIPFGWKLVGEANGLALTLFKAIERDDVEAQEERVRREGYYLKLRILANDDPVKQSSVFRKSVDSHRGTRTIIPKKTATKKPSRKAAARAAAKPVKKTAKTKPAAKAAKKASAPRRPKAGARKATGVKSTSKKKTPSTRRVKKAKTVKKVKARTPKAATPRKKTAAKAPRKRTRAKK